jgi:hypothetical protein
VTLRTSYINIRSGKLAAGLPDKPYQSKISIVLTGGVNGDNVLLD